MAAAKAHGRKVGLVGRSLYRMDECARENGYLLDRPDLVDEEDIQDIDPDKILLVCTGSQGRRGRPLPVSPITRIPTWRWRKATR